MVGVIEGRCSMLVLEAAQVDKKRLALFALVERLVSQSRNLGPVVLMRLFALLLMGLAWLLFTQASVSDHHFQGH